MYPLVPDGAEAIGKILQNDYAVIVLDLMMPRLDGFSVAMFLKERRVDKPFDIATWRKKRSRLRRDACGTTVAYSADRGARV